MRKWAALAAGAATVAAGAGFAGADNQVVRDKANDTPALERKGEIDIVRARAGHAVGDRVKHKVAMRKRLTPDKKNTRPFILINTKGGNRSAFEYLVVGPRVLKRTADGSYRKVGANKFKARKRTWVYSFKPEAFGDPDSYGWAAFTAKGKATDLAPDRRYKVHELR